LSFAAPPVFDTVALMMLAEASAISGKAYAQSIWCAAKLETTLPA
jgi:hypothetical protein